MNAHEHYRKAEKIVTYVDHVGPDDRMAAEQMANLLASAQVHSTLALAGALGADVDKSEPDDECDGRTDP